MAYYYGYAKKLDNIVRKYISDYRTAEGKLDAAKKEYAEYQERKRTGHLTQFERYLGDSADSVKYGTLKAAKAEFNAFREQRFDVLQAAQGIREELFAEIEKDYSVNPDKLDQGTMTLLSSGICKPAELCQLAEAAIKNGNHTMARIINSHIDKILTEDHNRHNLDLSVRTQLVSTSENVRKNDGRVYLERFDSLLTTMKYLTGDPQAFGNHYNENPAMFDLWDSLTSDTVENGFSD